MATIIKQGECPASLKYILTADGVLTISGHDFIGCIDDYDDEEGLTYFFSFFWDMLVREIIVEEGVTGLGEYCFFKLTEVERIVLPSTLDFINQSAFHCCLKLKKVEVPELLLEKEDMRYSLMDACVDTLPEEDELIKEATSIVALGSDGSIVEEIDCTSPETKAWLKAEKEKRKPRVLTAEELEEFLKTHDDDMPF